MKKTIQVLFLFCSTLIYAQEDYFGSGLVFDDDAYTKIPVAAKLSKGEYDNLPKSASLKQYAPTPGNQGKTGTCTAWSTAYHAYTIAESFKLNRTQTDQIDKEVFSPSFIYNQIRDVSGCDQGTVITHALNLMKTTGNLKLNAFPFNCEASISSSNLSGASKYKIYDYKTLFQSNSNQKIMPVKKALSENKPVVIGMKCCLPTFYNLKSTGIWSPAKAEYDTKLEGGHAMAVIGYDDDVNGGSFQIINSWGTGWGNGGFFWIKYSDFDYFVKYGFEMILTPPLVVDLNGEVEFKLITGETMQANFDAESGLYKMVKPYNSGTQFRFYMNNNQPAFVYAFGSDLSNKSYRIFPYTDSISAYLGYKSNKLAIPDEDHYVYMDNNRGKDYFCILYSKYKLDINTILSSMESTPGDFRTRLNKVLSGKIINPSRIEYQKNAIKFDAKSGEQSIVPIIIEMIHN